MPALEPALSWDVFSRFPSAACVIDAQRRFVACNLRWRRLLEPVGALAAPGAAFGDMMSAIVASGLVDTSGAADDADWIATATAGVLAGREFVLALRDGRQFQVESAALADGGLLVTLNDVTTSMRHEMALATRVAELERVQGKLAAQRAEMAGLAARLDALRNEAERANRTKSEFLANMSHELRTPLNAIIGFSEVMMEERFGPIGSERYRDYLKDIHQSGGHLISLINDLLDVSKIEAGKLELNFASVDLNEVAKQSMSIMQPQANRERIIIRSALAENLPPVVADERSIRQIVLNLLSNSVKFTKPGGQVILSTSLTEKGEVVLRVRDTGIGMSEEEVSAALEPFRQLSTSGRDRKEGTGLGLPLTKALAEANRASFQIKSAVNAGTLVEVAFPSTRVLAG